MRPIYEVRDRLDHIENVQRIERSHDMTASNLPPAVTAQQIEDRFGSTCMSQRIDLVGDAAELVESIVPADDLTLADVRKTPGDKIAIYGQLSFVIDGSSDHYELAEIVADKLESVAAMLRKGN